MTLPNLIIAGAQKCGTSWLHAALSKSAQIFGSTPKELNFFNKSITEDRLSAYRQHFSSEAAREASYRLESTPNYFFHSKRQNIANQVQQLLGQPKVIVLLRNPVDRYESAYIHHMMRRRFAYTECIDAFTDAHKMLRLGLYRRHLIHWRDYFSDILVLPYNRVQTDKFGLVSDIFDYLGLRLDLTENDLEFKANDRQNKFNAHRSEWSKMPVISAALRNRLAEHYDKPTRRLAPLVDFDIAPLLTEFRKDAP